MMKTFLCVVAAALTLSTAAVADDRADGAYGIVVLSMYAAKCMQPLQQLAFQKKLRQLSNAFSWAELHSAYVEAKAVLDRLGVQEFCDSTEAAATKGP